MENINFEHKKGQGFHITDFPSAEKVVSLKGTKAQKLADMALHGSDLRQAEKYLDMSVLAKDTTDTQMALWKMSIITFTKCFGKNNARTNSLDIMEVMPTDIEGQACYVFFKNLRDKNIAHDDNPISQCLVGGIISKKESPRKVEKIITMIISGEVNGDENIDNLRRLIKISHRYVEGEYDKLCAEITKDLEIMSHVELTCLESLEYKKPDAEDFSANRKKII